MEVLPIDCKQRIVSFLFPFTEKAADYHYDRHYQDVIEDINGITVLDTDINGIIENTMENKKKEISEYRNIQLQKHNHYVYNHIYVFEGIHEKRIPATHSNVGCYICSAALPISWPSMINKKHLYAGTCSKECFKKYKESQIWKNIQKREYKCGCCDIEVFPDDIDAITDDYAYCSSKCKDKYIEWTECYDEVLREKI
jgi:hypothetical protein